MWCHFPSRTSKGNWATYSHNTLNLVVACLNYAQITHTVHENLKNLRPLALSLMRSSIGLLPHSISTISFAWPGTPYEKGVPIPGLALDLIHMQSVKAYISGKLLVMRPYR